MAMQAFLSCGNGSYTTPNVEGQLHKKRRAFPQRFTKKLEEPLLDQRVAHSYGSPSDLGNNACLLLRSMLGDILLEKMQAKRSRFSGG